jgi:hypothetical protein
LAGFPEAIYAEVGRGPARELSFPASELLESFETKMPRIAVARAGAVAAAGLSAEAARLMGRLNARYGPLPSSGGAAGAAPIGRQNAAAAGAGGAGVGASRPPQPAAAMQRLRSLRQPANVMAYVKEVEEKIANFFNKLGVQVPDPRIITIIHNNFPEFTKYIIASPSNISSYTDILLKELVIALQKKYKLDAYLKSSEVAEPFKKAVSPEIEMMNVIVNFIGQYVGQSSGMANMEQLNKRLEDISKSLTESEVKAAYMPILDEFIKYLDPAQKSQLAEFIEYLERQQSAAAAPAPPVNPRAGGAAATASPVNTRVRSTAATTASSGGAAAPPINAAAARAAKARQPPGWSDDENNDEEAPTAAAAAAAARAGGSGVPQAAAISKSKITLGGVPIAKSWYEDE